MRARLLALAAVLALPTLAHAQTPATPAPVTVTLNVSLEDPGHAMAPGKNETLELLVNYQVGPGGVPGPGPNPDPTSGDPNSPNNTQRTKIHLSMKTTPSWVTNATFVPAVLEMAVEPGAGGASTRTAQLVFRIDPRAPALVKEEVVVVATADPNGNIQGKSAESPSINLKPAFIAKANVTALHEALIVPGGRWTDVPFVVKNLGNGEAKMKLNVTARPQDSQVEFPQTIKVARDASETVNVRLRIPWTYGEGGTLELEALPLSEDDSGKATKGDVDILGQSAVPGTGVFAILVAGGTIALARRRSG